MFGSNDPDNPMGGLLGDLMKVIGSGPGAGDSWFEAALHPGLRRGHRQRAGREPRSARAHRLRGARPGGRAACGRGHRHHGDGLGDRRRLLRRHRPRAVVLPRARGLPADAQVDGRGAAAGRRGRAHVPGPLRAGPGGHVRDGRAPEPVRPHARPRLPRHAVRVGRRSPGTARLRPVRAAPALARVLHVHAVTRPGQRGTLRRRLEPAPPGGAALGLPARAHHARRAHPARGALQPHHPAR